MHHPVIHAASGVHAKIGDLIILRDSTRVRITRMPTSANMAYVGYLNAEGQYREARVEHAGLAMLWPHRTSLYDGDEIAYKGLRIRVAFDTDYDHEEPWNSGDGYGIISEKTDRAKRPGEREIGNKDRSGRRRLYDVQATQQRALEEGWNAPPYTGTKRECAARAVQADYEFHDAWLKDEWHYVTITVTCLDTGEEDSCGGFETWRDSHMECAWEMIENLADRVIAAREDAARKAAEERARLQLIANEFWSLALEELLCNSYTPGMLAIKKAEFNELIRPAGVVV